MRVSVNHTKVVVKLGVVCLILVICLLIPSWYFSCEAEAFRVGCVSLGGGIVFGGLMALITRTRNPHVIYLALLGAGLSFWPLIVGWPAVRTYSILTTSHNPESALSYLEAVRALIFIFGIPTPFAYFGQHTSDIE